MRLKAIQLGVLFLFFAGIARGYDTLSIQSVLTKFEKASHASRIQFDIAFDKLSLRLNQIDRALTLEAQRPANADVLVRLLMEKIELKEELKKLEVSLELDMTKLRYQKGMELIRMLYEKILGLDHHFSSLKTHQNVNALSNPNSFPEFQEGQEQLKKRLRKDNSLNLPGILNTNPYLSSTVSIISSFIGSGGTKERETDLENISCIIDFTARMNSELSTIYYETEFLRESNATLKEECIQLFEDYTKVIKYYSQLDVCRREDDWESVYESLDNLIDELEALMDSDLPSDRTKLMKRQIDLEFSVDRLISFINQYNAFISNGEKYYQKFLIIVSNYPNEEICNGKLPDNFKNLRGDIEFSINKFNEAYNIAALKGSKLKDLLYGYSSN